MARRILGIAVAMLAATLMLAAPAWAGNPHFIKAKTSADLDGFNLVAEFKEAGLESGSVETIVLSAFFEGTYQCINGGGNNPNDPKKTEISGEISVSGEFAAAKNGQVTGSLTLMPPSASDVLDCPNGQTETLTAVAYSSISVTDLDTGASIALPGSYSAGSPVD